MSEREVLLKANGNGEKISKMWEKIVEKHGGKVIAVENGEIIGDAKTSAELIKTLENQKKDISSILIIPVPPTHVAYIL